MQHIEKVFPPFDEKPYQEDDSFFESIDPWKLGIPFVERKQTSSILLPQKRDPQERGPKKDPSMPLIEAIVQAFVRFDGAPLLPSVVNAGLQYRIEIETMVQGQVVHRLLKGKVKKYPSFSFPLYHPDGQPCSKPDLQTILYLNREIGTIESSQA